MSDDETDASPAFEPIEAIRDLDPYEVPRPAPPTDLHLDGNLGSRVSGDFVESLTSPDVDEIRAYPDRSALEATIAEQFGLPEERILVADGSNGVLDWTCRVALEPGRSMVASVPTFSLFPMFARSAGADLRQVEWRSGVFPTENFVESIGPETGLVVIVTPNNPTGLVATREQVERVVDRASEGGALTLIDHAYAEYTDRDLTSLAVERDDVVVTRTLSKAFGMAGLRIGYAVAAPAILETISVVGNPYPVSSLSVRVATQRLEAGPGAIDDHVRAVGGHRRELREVLASYGVETTDSEANFILARLDEPGWLHRALAGMGIAVRAFEEREGPESALRMTVPDDRAVFDRLTRALQTIVAPEALLVDLEGLEAIPDGEYDGRFEALRDGRPIGVIAGGDDAGGREQVERDELDGLVDAAVGSTSPDPDERHPVERLADRLGIDRAWLATGSTSDVRAARAADGVDVLPLGLRGEVTGSEASSELIEAGAATVWTEFAPLESRWRSTRPQGGESSDE